MSVLLHVAAGVKIQFIHCSTGSNINGEIKTTRDVILQTYFCYESIDIQIIEHEFTNVDQIGQCVLQDTRTCLFRGIFATVNYRDMIKTDWTDKRYHTIQYEC